VQALPSLHDTVLLVCWQPVAGTHESAVQTLPSSQLVAAPGWQVPPPQMSPVVQAFPSLHAAVLLVPGWQEPPEHVSPVVQGLPSLQAAVLSAWMQPDEALQESVVHGLPSLQLVVPRILQAGPLHPRSTQASPTQVVSSQKASLRWLMNRTAIPRLKAKIFANLRIIRG